MTDQAIDVPRDQNGKEIPLAEQTLDQLRQEEIYWKERVRNAPGFASANAADKFRKAARRWIEFREIEAGQVIK